MINQEPISVFDIFKIGIGPSSSHTLGPWRAARQFVSSFTAAELAGVTGIQVLLYGSLAKTGKGHGTDIAVMLGLCGYDPVTYEPDRLTHDIGEIEQAGRILLNGRHEVMFPKDSIHFLSGESLPGHPNALTIHAFLQDGSGRSATFYSVGGGFITQADDLPLQARAIRLPYPVTTAADLLGWCERTGLSIAAIVRENERAWRSGDETDSGLRHIFEVMLSCVYRGCHTMGVLPGGLNVTRRAALLNQQLLKGTTYADRAGWLSAIKASGREFSGTMNWVSCFALAVNEENAAFGKVVTAPTNGAAGVIPAVLLYGRLFCGLDDDNTMSQFLMTAAEVGSIFKKGATISAAMGGCQAEIGVSAAMAAAGLTAILGGCPKQVLMAAEIAMEHHLGLTCDPVGGLVQIPCIERNTMGAIKAITAAQLAMNGDPHKAIVPMDKVVKAMWDTALDMNIKYKETADGGLAVHVSVAVPEC